MISAWTHSPQRDPAREALAAQLGQVVVGGDAQLGRQVLHQHRHQVGGEHHPQQRVAELGPALEVGGEVARDRRRPPRPRTPGRASPGATRSRPRAQLALPAGVARIDDGARPSAVGAPRARPRASAASRASPRTRIARGQRRRRAGGPRRRSARTAARRTAGARPPRARRRARCRARPGSAACRDRSPRSARTCRARPARSDCRLSVLTSSIVSSRDRDRVAVRVVRGVAELGRDQLLELLGEHVLEHLGLLVDAIPRHAQALDQVELEQPVVADHLERHAPAGVGEQHAVVAAVRDQAELAQALDHPRRRGRRSRRAARPARWCSPAASSRACERVDRLGVVLDRGGDKPGGLRSGAHAKSKLWYA